MSVSPPPVKSGTWSEELLGSFPHVLESLEGVRRYISAFRAPLQELSALSLVQIHTLRACSLLAIPPPPERVPLQGGFPTDLSELNLSGWAALVQDVMAGLQALPPNLGCDMGLPVVALLQLLEVSTGVGFCCYCCRPGSRCMCVGAFQLVPPASWSQVVEQTPGYGVTTSSGGMTTPSTSVAGMPGYVAPSPGITHPDFSSWSLPPPEAPHPGDYPQLHKAYLALGDPYKLGLWQKGRLGHSWHRVQGVCSNLLRHSPHWHCTPLRLCHLHQPPPGWPATQYQQAVQPTGKPTGREITFNPSTDKTAPTGGPSSQDCGRPTTRGWGDGG